MKLEYGYVKEKTIDPDKGLLEWCHECHAAPLMPCRNKNGRVTKPHYVRVEARYERLCLMKETHRERQKKKLQAKIQARKREERKGKFK